MRKILSKERSDLLDHLVGQGVSIQDMHKLHGFNYKTVRKYYPDYRTWAVAIREDSYTVPDGKRQLVNELVDDRTPVTVIMELTGLTEGQVVWLAPNAAWTSAEIGELGAAVGAARKKGLSI